MGAFFSWFFRHKERSPTLTETDSSLSHSTNDEDDKSQSVSDVEQVENEEQEEEQLEDKEIFIEIDQDDDYAKKDEPTENVHQPENTQSAERPALLHVENIPTTDETDKTAGTTTSLAQPVDHPATIAVHFDDAQQVQITGDWLDWQKRIAMEFCENSKKWQCKLQLAPGRYEYKFIVNGSDWRFSDQLPHSGQDGFVNNFLLIE